jgi:hypothetical protein
VCGFFNTAAAAAPTTGNSVDINHCHLVKAQKPHMLSFRVGASLQQQAAIHNRSLRHCSCRMVCQAAAPAVQQSATPGMLDEHTGPSVLQQLDTIIFDCDGEHGMECSLVALQDNSSRPQKVGISARHNYVNTHTASHSTSAAAAWTVVSLNCHGCLAGVLWRGNDTIPNAVEVCSHAAEHDNVAGNCDAVITRNRRPHGLCGSMVVHLQPAVGAEPLQPEAVMAAPMGLVACNTLLTSVLILQALQVMRQQGKRLLFVTNNSSKSRAQYVKKFESLGMQVDSSEVSSDIPGCRRCSRCCTYSQQPCPCASTGQCGQ